MSFAEAFPAEESLEEGTNPGRRHVDVAGAAVAEPEVMTNGQVAEAVAAKEESGPSDVSEAVVPEIEPAAEETVVVEEIAILKSEPSLPAEAAMENESSPDVVAQTDAPARQVAESALLAEAPVEGESVSSLTTASRNGTKVPSICRT